MLFEKVTSVCYIIFVVLCFEKSALPTESFEVIRGRYDRFYNSLCSKGSGKDKCSDFCHGHGAVCDTSNICEYCMCQNGKNTYDGDKKKCVGDEDIIPESVEPGINFRIRTTRSGKDYCAKPSSKLNPYVKVEPCNLDSPEMLWVWTTGSEIKNIATDYCMEVTRWSKKIKIGPCSTQLNNQPQKFTCVEFWSRSVHLKNGNSFLRLSDLRVITGPKPTYKWNNYTKTDQSVCSTQTKGCYRFADGSFLQLLSRETCHGGKDCYSKEIAAPIFTENSLCTLEWTKSKFMRGEGSWKAVHGKNVFSIDDWPPSGKKRTIKIVNYTDAFQVWSGSLLRLEVACTAPSSSKEKHCVLLKFETLQQNIKVLNISKRFPKRPSNQPSTPSSTNISSFPTSNPSDPTTRSSQRPSRVLSDSPEIFPKRVPTSRSSLPTTALISVSIVLIVLILIITFGSLMFYRRLKRLRASRNIYEDPSPMYAELINHQRETSTEKNYQGLLGMQRPVENSYDTLENVYDYIDGDEQNTKNQTSNEDECSHAGKNEASKDTTAMSKPSTSGTPIYHTLEGPEVPGNPTSTSDVDQQVDNPVYAVLEETNVENESTTDEKADKDSSGATGGPSGDSDQVHNTLENSQREITV